MKHYKIVRGYGAEDYIEIDETELEKAYYAFLEKKDGVYSGGAVKGSEILAIQPDYHRAMGWNRGHKLGPDDYAELSDKGVDRAHMSFLALKKEHIQNLIQSGRKDLIGKNISLPKSETSPVKEVSEQAKELAEKFRIKAN